ncbi:FTR1 family protein [Candidatus Bathyarchaeota archaeon]|nr:FTR1 family protein [Candidatus Bathyarchaeota archaeon]MBL7078858.1 FTR1 family protein [Candidatus Bathyarchaeota archaeon]
MFEGLIPSLLITFREALEAALIVAIMVTYLKKVGKGELTRYAYMGSGAAVAISLVLGVAIQMVYGGMSKVAAELFEGVASLTAVAVLTYMIFWMTEHSKNIRGELQDKIDVAVSQGELYSVASLAFVAVFREGLETVLFLTTTFFQDAAGTIIGVVVGAAIVLVLAVLLMRGSYRLDIKKFFGYTSVILIVFSAGLAGYGVHELIEAGENLGHDFGVLGEKPFDINPPVNPDGTYPVLHEKGVAGSILKALVGYDGNPEWFRIIVYLGYWLVVGSYVFRTYGKPRDI